jgi:hypothetical protein
MRLGLRARVMDFLCVEAEKRGDRLEFAYENSWQLGQLTQDFVGANSTFLEVGGHLN